jgi:4-aminobutyrate aminotransferase/(S)-3-amino-2-methylpropionate transaminase
MGPRPAAGVPPQSIVLARGTGANVFDCDGNRYVDLAAGFGALLLGHSHPEVILALEQQSKLLLQALGDVYPSPSKIELLERLSALYPGPARALLAQSGSDAISAALKTAVLHTGRTGVVAFSGAYHGLGYGPLAALGLRSSYREPFAAQLNPRVRFLEYPGTDAELEAVTAQLTAELGQGDVGAVLVEPILGRGGVVVPPADFLPRISELARRHGALCVADEVWTGLGRAGALLCSAGATPDLICLGKGLGGGVPISAVIGRADVMQSWSREAEVVHTSTFAGAPLACAAALTTLDVLEREALSDRSRRLGDWFRVTLERALAEVPVRSVVRGRGLMLGVELLDSSDSQPGMGAALQRALLARGYITSSGGGRREVLVLTPPLMIAESQLEGFVPELCASLRGLAA